jgi:hypothetical protein
MFNILTTVLICTGLTPDGSSQLEIEIRPAGKFSVITYEYLRNWPGTTYQQTLGHFNRHFDGMNLEYVSTSASDPERATKLTAMLHGDKIMNARFTHMNSGMKNSPVDCEIDDFFSPPHSGH